MQIVVNGEARAIEDGFSIARLLEQHNLKPAMVVVEHNGEIVPRDKYEAIAIEDGDVLEIVQMMAGG